MKYVFEIKTERATTKAAINDASFKTIKDLTTSTGSDTLYAILDDETMHVSYFNTISQEKTEKYRHVKIGSARIALIAALRIAKKIKVALSVRGDITSIAMFENKSIVDSWDDVMGDPTSMYGRTLKTMDIYPAATMFRGKEFDALFKDEDVAPKAHNVAIINVHYQNGDVGSNTAGPFIRPGAVPRSVTIRTMHINDEEELLGCTAHELVTGLASEDISEDIVNHLIGGGSAKPLSTDPRIGAGLKLVVVKGKKGTICVPYQKFLDTIDIPEKLFNSTLMKLGLKGETIQSLTMEPTANMISRHQVGRPAVLYAVKFENLVRMKVFHVNIANGSPGEFENVQVK